MVAQFCKEPTVGAWKAQMRILAYLVGSTNHRLEVDRVKGTVWSSYSDSDQGGDRRFGCTTSRTGIMLCCNGMPYHWRSNKQPSTAMSSAAAEIVAMSECMKDVNLRMWIAEEIGIPVKWPVKILVDNKAGIHFQKRVNPDSKLKGVFDMRLGWLKELHNRKKFVAEKVDTEKNLADELTKPLETRVRKRLSLELKRLRQEVWKTSTLGGK